MKKIRLLTILTLIACCPGLAQVSIKKTETATTTNKAVSPATNTIQKERRFNQTYDFSNVKICVDRSNGYDPGERPEKKYKEIPRINSNGKIEYPTSVKQGLSIDTRRMWQTEQQITVALAPNQVSNIVLDKVKQYARVWETVANVKLLFTNDWHNALVKVGFTQGGGSWSWIGREVLKNPLGQATMNFGWFKNDTPDEEFRRVVLHEFGHALGFIHEHQAAGADIHWDTEKVYAFFGGPPNNWSRADVDRNIFYKYSQSSTRTNGYDKTSIMHYFFPQDLTTDNSGFTWNTTLSPLDQQFAKEVYPFAPAPQNATGVLHTGDDCDAINFKVEYNVGQPNVIEFVLKPGVDNAGKPISWWKQIGIPLKAGGENRNLQLAPDLKPVTQTLLVSDIDDTRGFSFAKAKLLGVHTGLGYTWNVWQALPGGCRITFTWQNDHCY